ncbi:MAG TPA: arginine decarboxylase [Roseiflexaceae bacterium]|nr:arginine decarboxylase [Roseiflexaceae bacterium]
MNGQTYLDHLQNRYGVGPEGPLTDFLSRRDGHLLLADQIDLNAMMERYGAPLEVVYCPLITEQIDRMQRWAAAARARTGYAGAFLYAYATKANFAEEVVRTALQAGAHYETSATADVVIAHQLWRQGVLAGDRLMFCNGSKDSNYIDAIVRLREAGYENVVPVLDDLGELEAYLARCSRPLLLGVRERHAAEVVDPAHPGGERFGLTPEEIARAAERLRGTPHQLVVYHAMVGSQMEHVDGWMARLERSAEAYCRLRQRVPTLRMFNFGGGMPTSAYALDFRFDYEGFLARLMEVLAATCAAHGMPAPDVVGEFGRYTVAAHNVYLLEVGALKGGQAGAPDWYLLNSSLMVTLPDMLIVQGQQFLVLPLEGWEAPAAEVRLAGRYTCDSDDFYPRPGQPPLVLPRAELQDVRVTTGGRPYVIAVFGVGAYQQMIAGRGGAHHCLTPEMRRVIIERDGDALVVREVAPQDLGGIMGLLGYAEELEQVSRQAPVPQPVRVERRPAREASSRPTRPARRRQPSFRARQYVPRALRSTA